tara:strand:- start:222 stop:497 length:276 start_codon:yes stop_codon:yes gene_type:complete
MDKKEKTEHENVEGFHISGYYFRDTLHWVQFYTVCILHIILSLIAAKLAWTCAQNLGFGIRLFNTFIASVFSELYIIYYAVYRVFMGNKCM